MVPESTPVRRLRRRPAVHRGALPPSVLAGVLATLLGTAAAVGVGDPATAAPPLGSGLRVATPAAVADGGVSLTIAPASPTAAQGGMVDVTVELVNASSEAIPDGQVHVLRAPGTIGDSAELEAWLHPEDPAPSLSGTELDVAELRSVAPGATATATISIPAEAIGAGAPGGAADRPAVIGLGAELVVGGTSLASGRSTVVLGAGGITQVRLATIYPLTVPESAGGLIDATDLELWTSPTGALTRQLDSVEDRSVAIGVDPRIIASIRILGVEAPASAVAWLERLHSTSNEIFPLAYGDADLAVQRAIGLDAPLATQSFDDAIAAERFPDGEAPPAGGAAPGGGAAATAAAPVDGIATEPPPPPLPTSASLLDWPYSRIDLAWPADETVVSGDLDFFARGGLTTTILSSANVEAPDEPSGAGIASSTVEDHAALVSDAGLSSAFRTAARATSDTDFSAATAEAAARLALVTGASDAPVLAAFDRTIPLDADRIPALLSAVAQLPWVDAASLDDATTRSPVSRALVDRPESETRVTGADRALRAETAVADFATVLENPELLTAPERRNLLALLSIGWLASPGGWDGAVADYLAAANATTGSVSVVPSSTITIISSEVPIRPVVQNGLPYPVTVTVTATPNNGRLIVEEDSELTIEANSRASAVIPVAAGVGNGEVRLTVTLTSPTGVRVGSAEVIQANVQADWEGIGAVIIAVAAVLFFGFGIARSIRRRRRERAGAIGGAVATPEPDSTGADSTEARSPGADSPTSSSTAATSPAPDSAGTGSPTRTPQSGTDSPAPDSPTTTQPAPDSPTPTPPGATPSALPEPGQKDVDG